MGAGLAAWLAASRVLGDTPVFDSGPLAPGATFALRVDATGVIGYHCTIHPGEHCTIVVEPPVIDITGAPPGYSPCAASEPGRFVSWHNASGASHSVTSTSGSELDSGPIPPGGTYVHEFPSPGTYVYHCVFHPAEQCTVTPFAPSTIEITGPGGSGYTPCDAVSPGSWVTWHNDSGVSHSVTSDSGNELDSGLMAPGATYTHAFSTGGAFNYHCLLHPTERCAVTVASVLVAAGNSGFAPCNANAIQGEYVAWRNTGGITHTVTSDATVSVPAIAIARSGFVAAPRPNPAKTLITFSFALRERAVIRLEVFTLAGECAARILEGERPAGAGEATWDVSGAGTRAVRPGVYFARLSGPGFSETRPVIVLR